MAYERALRRYRSHLLVMMDQIIHWKAMGQRLLPLYKTERPGRDDRPKSCRCY